MTDSRLVRAIGMGALAGLRSVGPPALLSAWLAKQAPRPALPPPLDLLAHPGAARLLELMALNEMVLDKLPGIGPRTAPPALAARFLSGALVGGVLASQPAAPPSEAPLSEAAVSAWEGAILGAMAAVVAAHVAVRLRGWLPRLLHLPGPVIGMAEDFFVIAAGRALLGEEGS